MTTFARSISGPICPVCAGVGRPLLTLPAQAIYQHPVPADADVPPPYTIDLSWVACTDCAHAWQPEFDKTVLEQIYRSHYYTPAPAGIGVQFQDDFLAALERFGLIRPRQALLEIGASAGDVLLDLKIRTGAARAFAFEPNKENAAVARQRGLDVRERFFGSDAVREGIDYADFIYARHVIEHIFQFDDFFKGLNGVAAPTADLVLETPSLDWHARQGSIDPFHIEHVHVFSLRSLARVGMLHGWSLAQSEVTAEGNLIASFKRGAAGIEIPPPILNGLQQAVDSRRTYLQNLLLGRKLIIWGAGSSGVCLVSTLGREPEFWTDGNPNKIGKRFVGLKSQIVSPQYAFAQAKAKLGADPVLVVASSFMREILPRARELGWDGEVLDLAGNRL